MALTKKQKEIYDYICSYFDKNGVAPTQKEIKEHFSFKSFGSVQRYIKYLKDEGLLETDWNARRGLKPQTKKEQSTNNVSSANSFEENEIALLGDVAAGIPIEAIENPTNTISVPPGLINKSGKHFALNVCGDSMIDDGILDGDIIICRYQQTANQGQTVVALVDGEATVKRFYKTKNIIELHPANKTMKPFRIDPKEQEVSLAGVLVGLIRSYE